MSGRLAGKIALVTGAGGHIGRSICVRFAKEGAAVTLLSRSIENVAETAADIESATGQRPEAIAVDLGSPTASAEVAQALGGLPRVDVLVNCAGISRPADLAETTDELWNEIMDVNVTGVLRITRVLAPVMPVGASIVNIGSTLGMVAFPRRLAYSTSKGALMQLTRALALELGPRGIRVNLVAPGLVDTPPLAASGARDRLAATLPLKRIPTMDEIAACALFLASDEASAVTGATLVADAGSTVGSSFKE
jgi:NAD(P)-dependent dehydrogenase (short-subunit alcohol dehydrogenase family)